MKIKNCVDKSKSLFIRNLINTMPGRKQNHLCMYLKCLYKNLVQYLNKYDYYNVCYNINIKE